MFDYCQDPDAEVIRTQAVSNAPDYDIVDGGHMVCSERYPHLQQASTDTFVVQPGNACSFNEHISQKLNCCNVTVWSSWIGGSFDSMQAALGDFVP
jgi:hypothetical protein